MTNVSTNARSVGLSQFDLPVVFHCAVELAEAAALLPERKWADLPPDSSGPRSPHFPRQREADRRLSRIEEETDRLKRALGATGCLRFAGGDAGAGPTWQTFEQRFKETVHGRTVRLALWKLATAAIDLSGFSHWRIWQWAMRDTGTRLLTWGLAQLWEGMSGEERDSVRNCLPRTHAAVGWPCDPSVDPPPFEGPDEIPLADQYRVTANYHSCHGGYLADVEKAQAAIAEQRRVKFLRRATPAQFLELAEQTANAIHALINRKFDSREEWSELSKRANYPMVMLRLAKEISPFAVWTATALALRDEISDAARALLSAVGKTTEASAKVSVEKSNTALQMFTSFVHQLREELARHSSPPTDETAKIGVEGTDSAGKQRARKRSTQKGDAQAKLIAAFLTHHKYADGGCLNWEPIGNNELARAAGRVSGSSAKLFFDKNFKGHDQYKALCRRDSKKVLNVLKALNGDFVVDDPYGDSPPGERDGKDK